MDNRHQFSVKSGPLMRRDTLAACRHFYGLHGIDEEVWPDESCTALVEVLHTAHERRTFAVAANAIREEEKARVARELHDELAQALTALKMDTLWVRDNAARASDAVTAKLTDMVAMLDHTVTATRRIAADLRPMLLDDLGLLPAIEWLVGSFTQRCGVACSLNIDEGLEFELQEPYATAVFRIVQESLANVAKHAHASQVTVTLGKAPDAVMLAVRDDGCGFFTTAPRKSQSMGLMGLRERAQLLGGDVSMKSALGQGTCIEVHIPLTQAGIMT